MMGQRPIVKPLEKYCVLHDSDVGSCRVIATGFPEMVYSWQQGGGDSSGALFIGTASFVFFCCPLATRVLIEVNGRAVVRRGGGVSMSQTVLYIYTFIPE